MLMCICVGMCVHVCLQVDPKIPDSNTITVRLMFYNYTLIFIICVLGRTNQRTTCGSQCSPFTNWFLGSNLGRYFWQQAPLPALLSHFPYIQGLSLNPELSD